MSNKKKMEVLYFVEQYIKRYGYPPTVRDIGKGLGYIITERLGTR